MKKREKKKALVETYKQSFGCISDACKAVGCNRDTFYSYYHKDSRFKKSIDAIDEDQLDLSESQLKKACRLGEAWAVTLHLKTKGKGRGYIEGKYVITEEHRNLKVAEDIRNGIQNKEIVRQIHEINKQMANSDASELCSDNR